MSTAPDCWQLDGPRGFVRHVSAQLRDGRNVIVCWPANALGGFLDALRDCHQETELPYVEVLDLVQDKCKEEPPARQIHRSLGVVPNGPASAVTLLADDLLTGRIVFISCASQANQQPWFRFINEYQRACLAQPVHRRLLICLSVLQRDPAQCPKEDAGLAVHSWQGIVSRLDATIEVHRVVSQRGFSPLIRDVHVAISVELAGSDLRLARILGEADLEELLDPIDLLRKYGASHFPNGTRAPSWIQGTLDSMDGILSPHSAFLALNGGDGQIRRRIWQGQVSVLFAFVETARLGFVERHRGRLEGQLKTLENGPKDLLDCELPILHEVAARARLGQETMAQIRVLRGIRNQLAHLQPIGIEILLSSALQRAVSVLAL